MMIKSERMAMELIMVLADNNMGVDEFIRTQELEYTTLGWELTKAYSRLHRTVKYYSMSESDEMIPEAVIEE